MKNVQISLPDDLARDAIRELRKDNLRNAMDRMASAPMTPAMAPESVALEIAAFQAEQRAQNPAH